MAKTEPTRTYASEYLETFNLIAHKARWSEYSF